MEFKTLVNAALKFLEKRIATATGNVTKSVDRLAGAVSGTADAQSRALAKLGVQFEAATKRMEKPTFDVQVDLEPLLVELTAIQDTMATLANRKGPNLSLAEGYLKLILAAIERNAPEKIGEKIDAMDAVFKGLKPKDSVKFDDNQMKGLMAALTNRGIGLASGGTKAATQYEIDRLALTLADTEYTYSFPENTVSWTFKLRGSQAMLYWSTVTGKLPVSGDNTQYITMDPMGTRSQDNMEWGGKTLYFETDTASQVLEIEIYTM
jgi:hypothetical protein